jgi:hypothetical protein
LQFAARQRPFWSLAGIEPAVGNVVPHHAGGIEGDAGASGGGGGAIERQPQHRAGGEHVGSRRKQRADAQQAQQGQQSWHE